MSQRCPKSSICLCFADHCDINRRKHVTVQRDSLSLKKCRKILRRLPKIGNIDRFWAVVAKESSHFSATMRWATQIWQQRNGDATGCHGLQALMTFMLWQKHRRWQVRQPATQPTAAGGSSEGHPPGGLCWIHRQFYAKTSHFSIKFWAHFALWSHSDGDFCFYPHTFSEHG